MGTVHAIARAADSIPTQERQEQKLLEKQS